MADILLLDNIDSFTYNPRSAACEWSQCRYLSQPRSGQTLIDRLATMQNPVLMLSPGRAHRAKQAVCLSC